MAKKISEVKKVDKKIEKLKAPGNKLKIAIKATKKLKGELISSSYYFKLTIHPGLTLHSSVFVLIDG